MQVARADGMSRLFRVRRMSCRRYFISQHPEVEARIVEELRSLDLLATPERPRARALEYADLGKLVYLSSAIKVCVCRVVATRLPLLAGWLARELYRGLI